MASEDTELRKLIVEKTSEMLDNPDSYGIYPTTHFYDELERGIVRLLAATPQPPARAERDINVPSKVGEELTFEQQEELTHILEAYRNNPSNSNKYRYQLFAKIDEYIASHAPAALLDRVERDSRNEGRIEVLREVVNNPDRKSYYKELLYNELLNEALKLKKEAQQRQKLAQIKEGL
jgi:hypothetical protein